MNNLKSERLPYFPNVNSLMKISLGLIFFTILSTAFVYAETISVDVDGTSFDVQYTAVGMTVTGIESDTESASLIFSVDVTDSTGILNVELERSFFDSIYDDIDDLFFILADGDEAISEEEIVETTDTDIDDSDDVESIAESEEVEEASDDDEAVETDLDEEIETDEIDEDLEEILETETSVSDHQITSEDLDVQEDIDAMLNGQDLSEEYQEQVKTIFEAAVVNKVNEKIEDIYSTYESDIESHVVEIRQELSEKVDEYLSYVASEYITENKLAIESGLKMEIMENFMSGIKGVFEENYIELPEEQLDLYSEALETLDSKESELNEQFEKNIQLNKRLVELEKDIVLMNVTEGLTDTQVDKIRNLSENVEFDNTDDMTKKITLIKDNYFPSETSVESGILDESALETSVEDSPVVQEENKVQSTRTIMDVYAHALNKPKD